MKIGRLTTLYLLLAAEAFSPMAWSGEAEFLHWEKWTQGADLAGGYLGHFSGADSQGAPAGALMGQVRFHLWYEHLLAPYALFGMSPNGTLMGGGGMMINLFEYARDPFGDWRSEMTRRGLLSGIIQNFMIYISPEMVKYSLVAPDPDLSQSWDTTPWSFQPAVGVQWYFWLRSNFSKRYYLELSSNFAIIDGNKFLFPLLRLGIELK
jgi:hypothetical protein